MSQTKTQLISGSASQNVSASTVVLSGATSGTTTLSAPAAAGNNTLTLPTGNGTNGQVLSTNGSGALSWATLPASGKILQVVQATTDTQTSTGSTTYVDVSGLSASITPSATSSKILIRFRINASTNSNSNVAVFQIVRDSTAIGNGNQGSNRRKCHAAFRGQFSDPHPHATIAGEFLDSPSSISAITYKIQYNVDSGTVYLNRDATNSDTGGYPSPLSSITLMEVAA